MMNRTKKAATQGPEARARENQVKFVKDAVTKVEKNYGKLCGQMGSVNRRSGRLRDKFDEMAKFVVAYASTEPVPLKVALTQFAEHISAIQDYRQALIERMDGKVIQPLSSYETACKHTHTDLNATIRVRGKELKQHKQLETLRNKEPSNTQRITRAETNLQRATIDMERSSKSLEETIDKFETQRVKDIQKILSEFVQIEMLFHAKALERLTTSFRELQEMNVDEHLMLFRNTLRPNQVQQRLDLVRQTEGMNLEDQNRGQDSQPTDVYAIPKPRSQRTRESSPGDQQEEYEDQEEEYDEDEYSEEEESEYETEEEEEEEYPETQQQQPQRLKPW